jgi:tetratricopeptide (TPR) repeat protein
MLARTHSLVPSLVRCYFGYGVTLTGQGEYDAALAVFEEGLALTERVGDELYHCRLLNSLGWLYFELGNLDHALDLNRRSAEGARHRGNPETIANAELNLGDFFLAKGDLPLAREFLDSVHRLVQDPTTGERMKWRYSTHLFASWGEFWLARGSLGEARQYADRCLEIATRTNSRKYLVKAWRLRGEIALVRGQWEDAERALRQALTLAKALRNPTQCWRTYLAIGRLYRESKRAEASRRAYGAARQVIAGITANLQDPGLRASLTRAPLSQEVYHPNFARNLGTK